MGWWSRMTSPLRRFSFRVASRLGFRKRGLLKLGRDVRACEYGDVQVMWEMVKRNEKEVVGVQERRRKRRSLLNILWWGGSGACIGCRFWTIHFTIHPHSSVINPAPWIWVTNRFKVEEKSCTLHWFEEEEEVIAQFNPILTRPPLFSPCFLIYKIIN